MRAGGGTNAGDDWGLVAGRGEVVEQGSHMFGVDKGMLRRLVRMNRVVEDGWFWRGDWTVVDACMIMTRWRYEQYL